jgi:hypothetical protein
VGLAIVLLLGGGTARAQDAGSATGASVGGCVETIPTGGNRPLLKDTFPERGLSGYAATLVVIVEHGKGETVLPQGFQIQSSSAAAKVLTEAGWASASRPAWTPSDPRPRSRAAACTRS